MVLLSTAYFPPIEYFAALAKYSVVYLEACENYQKQSYRNRCVIYTANGPDKLNVPIVHRGGGISIPIREVQLDYSTPWVKHFQRTIDSAYNSSAFFEYYRDGLYSILDSRPEYLFDLNLSILHFFLKKIGIQPDIRMTDHYTAPDSGIFGRDLRNCIHPKKENTILEELSLKKPYFQVFSQKYGFISNLSILDLLFNEGPESISYLKI